ERNSVSSGSTSCRRCCLLACLPLPLRGRVTSPAIPGKVSSRRKERRPKSSRRSRACRRKPSARGTFVRGCFEYGRAPMGVTPEDFQKFLAADARGVFQSRQGKRHQGRIGGTCHEPPLR